MTDPFSAIDELLDRWAVWHRWANRPPTGGYGNPLLSLQAEGAEVERGGRQTREARRVMAQIRAALRNRIRAAQQAGRHEDALRLAIKLAQEARTINGLPWASLIAGVGPRPEAEKPDEERMERIISTLNKSQAGLVRLNYLWWATQPQKARRLRLSVRTYQRRLSEALGEIGYHWDDKTFA